MNIRNWVTLCRLVVCCLFLLFLGGCKSSRQAVVSPVAEDREAVGMLESIIGQAPSFDSFSSKVKLTASMNGKQLSVNGTLKMKRGELIQLSIAPLLGIEVARIEISKDNILAIDRINRQYASVSIADLSSLADGEADFYTIQALFFNRLSLPGAQEVKVADASAFRLEKQADGVLIRPRKTGKLDYCFTANEGGWLVNTNLSADKKYLLDWKYDEFQQLGGGMYPAAMDITVQGTGRSVKAQVELSKMSTAKVSLSPTTLSGKYKPIDTDALLKLLFAQ